jgi:hypothetical protein
MLGEFLLGDGRDGAVRTEHDGAGGGRALVNGENVIGHGLALLHCVLRRRSDLIAG